MIRNTNSQAVLYLICILLSTYSVTNTPNLPKKYLTATVNSYSRSGSHKLVQIIPNSPNKVQNRGIRLLLDVICIYGQTIVSIANT